MHDYIRPPGRKTKVTPRSHFCSEQSAAHKSAQQNFKRRDRMNLSPTCRVLDPSHTRSLRSSCSHRGRYAVSPPAEKQPASRQHCWRLQPSDLLPCSGPGNNISSTRFSLSSVSSQSWPDFFFFFFWPHEGTILAALCVWAGKWGGGTSFGHCAIVPKKRRKTLIVWNYPWKDGLRCQCCFPGMNLHYPHLQPFH